MWNSHYSHKTYSQLPIIGTFKGNSIEGNIIQKTIWMEMKIASS